MACCTDVAAVASESKGDQAAVAIVPRPEPFKPQRMSGDQSLQCGAAVAGDFDAGEPQFAAVGERNRAAIAHGGDARGADCRELAGFLRCRIAHKERSRRRRRLKDYGAVGVS